MSCTRFEDELLLAREEGQPPDPHVATCEDCQKAQAAYERLEQSLRTHSSARAPAGWEEKVLARVDQPKRRRLTPAWLGVAAAACLAVVGLFALRPRHVAQGGFAVETELQQDPTLNLRGGEGAHAGDVLLVRARIGNAKDAELRVYRDDRELVFRCTPRTPSCSRRGDLLEGALRLPAVGSYQAVGIIGTGPLPDPSGSLDDDTARAVKAGAKVSLAPAVRAY